MSDVLWFEVGVYDFDEDPDQVQHDVYHALDDYGVSMYARPRRTGTGRERPSTHPHAQAPLALGDIAAKLFSHYGDDAHILSAAERKTVQEQARKLLSAQLPRGS